MKYRVQFTSEGFLEVEGPDIKSEDDACAYAHKSLDTLNYFDRHTTDYDVDHEIVGCTPLE